MSRDIRRALGAISALLVLAAVALLLAATWTHGSDTPMRETATALILGFTGVILAFIATFPE